MDSVDITFSSLAADKFDLITGLFNTNRTDPAFNPLDELMFNPVSVPSSTKIIVDFVSLSPMDLIRDNSIFGLIGEQFLLITYTITNSSYHSTNSKNYEIKLFLP